MSVGHKKALLALVGLMLTAYPSNAQTWKQVGPPGGDVQSLAAAPGSAQTLFLGTTDGHVFGSHDGGDHWALLGRIGEHHDDVIMSMVVDKRSANVIYATSWTLSSKGGGVYRSTDGGHTWLRIGLDGLVVRAIAEAPSNPDILVAGALDGVYRSTDSGKSWARISPEKHENLRNFDSIAIDPDDPDIIYAGTYHLPWKTVDGGKNWTLLDAGMDDDSDVMGIAIDQYNPAQVLASTCSGIYRSRDGGAHWAKFNGIPEDSKRAVHILADPKRPATIYDATTTGLWKSVDSGENWRQITPASWSILSMVIDPNNTDRLILGTERLGVQISGDGGKTYRAANEGFAHRRIVDTAVDPQHPERALVALTSTFEPLLETKDAGHTWSPLATGLKSGPPEHIFASPDGWFAAPRPGGLQRYDASRNSWVSVDQIISSKAAPSQSRNAAGVKTVSSKSAARNPVSRVGGGAAGSSSAKTIVPFDAKVNDMAFGESAWYAATEDGLMVSLDRGHTWRMVDLTPDGQKAAPSIPALTTASMRAVRLGRGNSYVWALSSHELEVSGDNGETWISRALPFESRGSLHLHPSDEKTVVLSSNHGVYVSHDMGESWRQASLSELSIDGMTPVNKAVIISTAKGDLFVSRDAGKTWGQLNGPGAEESISALRSREAGNQVVAASATEGLFVMELGAAATASAGAHSALPAGGE